jgi:hypothetical protein
MKTYATTARDFTGPVPDPRGFPHASAMARLTNEKELWPHRKHWSYDPKCARKARRFNQSKREWARIAELDEI